MLYEVITFTLGADPDRLAWGMSVAREAAAAGGRDPDSLRFGAYVNLACHPDRNEARNLVRLGEAEPGPLRLQVSYNFV